MAKPITLSIFQYYSLAIAKMKRISNFFVKTQQYYGLVSTFILTSVFLASCSINIVSFRKSDKAVDLPIQKNLVLHLKADSGVATQGGQVTGWVDNSLVGHELVASGDPIFIANSLNNHSTIRLDGNDDMLASDFGLEGLPTGNTDRTIFMVVKYNSEGFGGFTYGQSEDNNAFGLVVDKEGYLAVQAWGSQNDRLTMVDGKDSGWLTQSAKLEAGILSQYKDGVKLSEIAHNYDTKFQQLVIGVEIDRDHYVDMEVAEIIVFERALKEKERQEVEAYLKNKYFTNG